MVNFRNVPIETFPKVNHDAFFSLPLVLHDHLRGWQVNVEVVKTISEPLEAFAQVLLLVVKLHKGVSLHFLDNCLRLCFKHVHFRPHGILLC